MLKKILILFFAIVLIASSCAGKQGNIRDDVLVSDIAAAADTHLNADNFASMNDSYLMGAMKLDTSLFEDYIVKVNAYGANIDEYGIFKVSDSSQVSRAENAVKEYLDMRGDTWMEEYMPEEKPKLEAAEVKSKGLYIMYAILSDQSRTSVLTEFENILIHS